MRSNTLKEYLEKNCALTSADHITNSILEDPDYIEYCSTMPMRLVIANTGFVLWINTYGLRLTPPEGAALSKQWAYSKRPQLLYKTIKTHDDILKYINTSILELEL